MLELAWVLKAPNAVTAEGSIDGLSKVDFASEAVAALDNVLKPDKYGISLSKTGNYTFPAAAVGYPDQKPYSVSVKNNGGPTGKLGIALSGTGSKYFKLSKTSISSLDQNGSDSFTVKPKAGLKAGTYKAKVTVTGSNKIASSFTVSFTVKK